MIEETDPVPAALVGAARASFTWRTIDAELAELTSDSALDAAAVRSTRAPRLLTFTAGETTLVVQVAPLAAGQETERRLLGQLVAPRPARGTPRHRFVHRVGRRVRPVPGRTSARGPDQPCLPLRRSRRTHHRHQLGLCLTRRSGRFRRHALLQAQPCRSARSPIVIACPSGRSWTSP